MHMAWMEYSISAQKGGVYMVSVFSCIFIVLFFVSDLNTQNHHLKSNGCGALYRGPNYQLYGEFAASLGAPSGPLQLEEHWAVA